MDLQNILKQLEVNEGTFPREAVAQAIEQREAMTPELLRVLEDAYDNIEEIAEWSNESSHTDNLDTGEDSLWNGWHRS